MLQWSNNADLSGPQHRWIDARTRTLDARTRLVDAKLGVLGIDGRSVGTEGWPIERVRRGPTSSASEIAVDQEWKNAVAAIEMAIPSSSRTRLRKVWSHTRPNFHRMTLRSGSKT